VDGGIFNLTEPATLLIPTDEAWAAALVSFGFNKTTLQEIDDFKLGVGALAVILYNEFPNVTLMRANFTNGQSLPTSYEGENITVHINPANGNITFTGYRNATFPASFNNTANLLFPDIPVKGSNGNVMHVVDRVLVPSPEGFNRTVQTLVQLAEEGGEEEGGPAEGPETHAGATGTDTTA
jgi:hypothetical protein